MDRHHHTSSALWRWPAAALLAATAGIHIALAPPHLHEAFYAGVLFIALGASALTVAGLLVVSDRKLVWAAAGMLSITALLAYAASRSVGLPSLGDDVGDWLNPLGVAAMLCETVTVLICVRGYAGTADFAATSVLRVPG